MEIYYTTKLSGRAGLVSSWSKAPGYPALLAVGLTDKAVGIYTEEGRQLDPNNELTIRNVRGTECAKLAWHPLLPLLAIGWRDGGISFWNAEERKLEEDSKIHRTCVTAMVWTASGDRLVTGDENGRISMWKTDRLMRPIHVVAYDEPQAKIKHIIIGPQEDNPETGTPITVAVYTVSNGSSAIIKWCNDQGYSGLVQDPGEDVHALLLYPERAQLLVVSSSCTLSVLAKDETLGTWAALSKMKFATGTGEAASGLQVCWAGNHTLASASEKDNVVRMFNFDTEDNYVIPVEQDSGVATRVVCLAFDERYALIAAGTADGRVLTYKCNAPAPNDPLPDLAKLWEAQPAFHVGNRALHIEWGVAPRLAVVVCNDAVNVCRKTLLSSTYRDGFCIMQTAVDKVSLEQLDTEAPRPPRSLRLQEMQLLGLDISRGLLLVYDGYRAEVYKVNDSNEATAAQQFECAARAMAINNDSLYRTADNRLEVLNMQGVVKQTLPFDEAHGSPIALDVSRDHLAAVTNAPQAVVRVFKVAGREAKPHAGPGNLLPAELAGWAIDCMRVNGLGTLVAAIVSSPDTLHAQRLVVWSSEGNNAFTYDFSKDGRTPVHMLWDSLEPKMLVVQTSAAASEAAAITSEERSEAAAIEVATMFVHPDNGILLQEYQPLHTTGASACVGSAAPYLLTNKKSQVALPNAQPFTSNVTKLVMQGFAGLQDSDAATRKALVDFSYHMALGNMDEAFRAVRTIKSTAVWENMAHLCIKNKRLDVAEHCLGNMQHVRGARALREAKANIEEADARVGAVAVHLGMVEDAKKLFIQAERFDLLNTLYRACGAWDKALEIAGKSDRIHLRATHYAYAQYLERAGDLTGAQSHYESAGCGQWEVPRMLFEAERLDDLHKYITAKDSKELTLWWGKYLESTGDTPRALEQYRKAGDSLSTVRVHCGARDWAAAEKEVAEGGEAAAAFHLARQYEAQSRIPEAIRYYTLSKRYSHGVRLAKAHDLDADLMNLALKSTSNVMIDTADYLYAKGQHEKAAMLYMKGGKTSKAVSMCFEAQLFDVLQHIADDLQDGQGDPALYARCADFFSQHGQHDKAVRMLIAAQQYSSALELCVRNDVAITEEMADAMTPDKDVVGAEERNHALCQIAKVAKRQGNFQLAAKKYTQAGEKAKAMKALLRSGDTEKIIVFAGVSRQKDIYLMAAHYLQTLNWHSNAELIKNIITFYTKAQAMDSLATFYEACAQIEIDEYRDYEKALQAMREAARHAAKIKGDDDGRDMRVAAINNRIGIVETFVRAHSLIRSAGEGPQQALGLCGQLLQAIPAETGDLEGGIRVGDVYALMVEYWYEQRQPMEAYKLIEQMRRRSIILSPYLDARMIEDIYKALGMAPLVDERAMGSGGGFGGSPRHAAQHGGGMGGEDDDGGGFVEEDVVDDD